MLERGVGNGKGIDELALSSARVVGETWRGEGGTVGLRIGILGGKNIRVVSAGDRERVRQ